MIKPIINNKELLSRPAIESPVDSCSLCIALDLKDTLKYAWANGSAACSISATEIGESEAIIAISNVIGGDILVMFNPKIISHSDKITFWEDNLTVPNKLLKNERAHNITVDYQTENGDWQTATYTGKLACLIQQEVDNLLGSLPETRAISSVDIQTNSL